VEKEDRLLTIFGFPTIAIDERIILMPNIRNAALLCWLLASTVPLSASALKVQISSQSVEWVRCTSPYGLRLKLRVQLINDSNNPVVVGRIGIANERLYREIEQDKLELIHTTAIADDFASSDILVDPTTGIQEKIVQSGATEIFVTDRIVYLPPTAISVSATARKFVASFQVTNVLKNGTEFSYWTAPIPIALPNDCTVK
jgi:hypothetical protein